MEQQHRKMKYRGRKAVPMQYRRKRSWKKTLLILGGVLVLCIATAILVPYLTKNDDTQDVDTTLLPDQVIHVVAGGNVNITDESIAAGKTDGGYDYQQVFKDVLPILSSGDITILNLEGVVSGNQYNEQTKATPPELLTALKNTGVDILQTANSYSLYDGPSGMASTIQGIQNAGMTPLGTYASEAEAQAGGGYIIWEVNGIKVAMMAFTKGMISSRPGIPDVSKNCLNLLYTDYEDNTYQKVNTEGIQQVVRNASAHDPDVMIALVHWGGEESTQISKTQEKICKILQDEGVSAIIGTHPHNVQKMQLDKETGQFVAWSLGDFYGDMAGTNYSVLLDLEITKDGKTGQTKVTGFEYVPVYMHKEEGGKIRVLRINEAIAAYENRYLDRVSEDVYKAMTSALESIKSRLEKK